MYFNNLFNVITLYKKECGIKSDVKVSSIHVADQPCRVKI